MSRHNFLKNLSNLPRFSNRNYRKCKLNYANVDFGFPLEVQQYGTTLSEVHKQKFGQLLFLKLFNFENEATFFNTFCYRKLTHRSIDCRGLMLNCLSTGPSVNPIQDGPFRGCPRMGWQKRPPLLKICYTYPTMMKLGALIS